MKIHEYNEMMAYLTRPAVNRVGFAQGSGGGASSAYLNTVKKATEKKYKDFVKAFKKKNKRAPSQFEIRTQIAGGGDWESIHKYLEEGKDFLTKSDSMKLTQGAKTLIEDMPKGMSQWMKSNNIEVDWTDINNQERARLKKRFANRNNPYFKKLDQRNKFESYIDDLIKKGEPGSFDKSLPQLIKDSGSNVSIDVGQDVVGDKDFFLKRSKKEKVFPKLEKRAIELLNEGLSAPEVTQTLADEGVIKIDSKHKKRTFTHYYNKLLKDKKLNVSKIAETIPGFQIPKAERDMVHNAILDYMKKNPDVDSATDIAKAVTVGINRKISGAFVENSLERAGLNPNELFKNKAQKIFDDVKVLDKVIKSNQKLLKDPNVSFAEKNRQFVRLYANATGKSMAEASGEFITRLRKLGQLYTKQPQRFATELYNKIKTPLDYINSDFQKNFVGLTDAAGNLGVVDKAKLLGLPKSEIKLLSELSGAVSKLGAVKMAGDHTDIDSLMKNFPNYRKNYTRIEFITDKLNDYKGKYYDNKVLSLFRAAKKGQTHTIIDGKKVPIAEALNNLQSDFFKKTGHRLGGFELSATGEISIKPQTIRIPDLKHPINTKLRETLKGLETYKVPGGKPTKITNLFDRAMMNANTLTERKNVLKKYQGTSELANSRYIKALGSIPRFGKLVEPLIAGTIGAVGISTLASAADGTEAGSILPEAAAGAGAAGAYTARKPIWKGIKAAGRVAGKTLAPLVVPLEAGFVLSDLKSGASTPEALANIVLAGGLVTAKEKRDYIIDKYGKDVYSQLQAYKTGEDYMDMPQELPDDFKAIQAEADQYVLDLRQQRAAEFERKSNLPKPEISPWQAAEGGRVGFDAGGIGDSNRSKIKRLADTFAKWKYGTPLSKLTDKKRFEMEDLAIKKLGLTLEDLGITKFNEGGRVGFKDGSPKSPGRRAFLKGITALAALPIVGKYFKLGKVLEKAQPYLGPTVEKIKGMPEWFPGLVKKLWNEGEDVTKQVAYKERQVVKRGTLEGGDDVDMIYDMDTGDVSIQVTTKTGKYETKSGAYNKEYELDYVKGQADETTKGKKPPDEFSFKEIEGRMDQQATDVDWDVKYTTVDDAMTDLTELEAFAKDKTTKQIHKKKGTKPKDVFPDYDPY